MCNNVKEVHSKYQKPCKHRGRILISLSPLLCAVQAKHGYVLTKSLRKDAYCTTYMGYTAEAEMCTVSVYTVSPLTLP